MTMIAYQPSTGVPASIGGWEGGAGLERHRPVRLSAPLAAPHLTLIGELSSSRRASSFLLSSVTRTSHTCMGLAIARACSRSEAALGAKLLDIGKHLRGVAFRADPPVGEQDRAIPADDDRVPLMRAFSPALECPVSSTDSAVGCSLEELDLVLVAELLQSETDHRRAYDARHQFS
jgi:hypothetical protein